MNIRKVELNIQRFKCKVVKVHTLTSPKATYAFTFNYTTHSPSSVFTNT